MTYSKLFLLGASFVALVSSPVLAQGTSAATSVQSAPLSAVEKSIAQAKAELADKDILAQKIALAQKMHDIRPTRDQVDAAVTRASLALPVRERQGFVRAMASMLNYHAIERISMDAMLETYTLTELIAMVEYFSKPEAISASNKLLSWAQLIQPEMVRMIDKAMMRIRTGQ